MPESQNPAATEPSADPAEEIQAKKAAAADLKNGELNGNEVKEPSAEDKEDTNDALEDEDDEVADEDDEAEEAPETAEEKNGKQSRKRASDVNGHDEEEESNGDQPDVKKTRTEAEEAEEDDSANLVEPEDE